eukprot:364447-Chlamydomonas_euryale.AAC.2
MHSFLTCAIPGPESAIGHRSHAYDLDACTHKLETMARTAVPVALHNSTWLQPAARRAPSRAPTEHSATAYACPCSAHTVPIQCPYSAHTVPIHGVCMPIQCPYSAQQGTQTQRLSAQPYACRALNQCMHACMHLLALQAVDAAFLQYTITGTIDSGGQSVMLLFAFEYVIQVRAHGAHVAHGSHGSAQEFLHGRQRPCMGRGLLGASLDMGRAPEGPRWCFSLVCARTWARSFRMCDGGRCAWTVCMGGAQSGWGDAVHGRSAWAGHSPLGGGCAWTVCMGGGHSSWVQAAHGRCAWAGDIPVGWRLVCRMFL